MAGKPEFFQYEKIKNLYEQSINDDIMFEHLQNGPIMPSSESKTVQNDEFLSKLEEKLITLSAKYGLGEVLFMEENPLNIDSFASFYIRAPKTWTNQEIFDVWDLISEEVDDFAMKEGCNNLMEICNVAVSDRY